MYASPTGYARSKLIAERMIEKAVTSYNANAIILRIGQIVPAKKSGLRLWNPSEMIPLLVRSALSTRALPDSIGGSDSCSWIDVDTLSQAIIEIGDMKKLDGDVGGGKLVYNLVHPRPMSWKGDFLPALEKAGLVFEVVSWEHWMERLKSSEKDVEENPSRKLLGFWEAKEEGERRIEVIFETDTATEMSNALKTAETLIDGKYAEELLKAWHLAW